MLAVTFLFTKIDPIVKSRDFVVFDFVHKNMFKATAAHFAIATRIQCKPNGFEQVFLTRTIRFHGAFLMKVQKLCYSLLSVIFQ